MGLLNTDLATVNGKKPRNSDRILPAEELNFRGLLDAATNVPVVGDALSGGMAIYDAAKGDYGSAAMNALGVLPFLSAGMIKGAAKVADAVKPMTKYEQAHEVARQNAVKMLGLPENNTAMDRARAMGFDTPAYHGTGADIPYFVAGNTSPHTAGSAPSTMHWMSGEPSVANGYALSAYYSGNPNVMPLMLKTGKEFSRDMKGKGPMALPEYSTDAYAGKKLKTNDTVTLENFKDAAVPGYGGGMGTHIAVKDPANIRSRFAAFDPMRRHEADLLGYADPNLLGLIAGGGLLGLGGYKLMGDK